METSTHFIPVDSSGKLQNNIAAPYDFTIGNVINESWKRVKGTKMTYWGALLICISIYIGLFAIGLLAIYLYTGSLDQNLSTVQTSQGIVKLIATLLTLPLPFGIGYIALRRSVNLSIKAKQLFKSYRFYWKILGAVIIMYAGIFLITVAFVLADTYLIIAINNTTLPWLHYLPILVGILGAAIGLYFLYSLNNAPLLMIEKQFGLFQSLKTSFLAFNQHGIKILVTIFCMLIIYFVSMIPFGIGLIWTLPMLCNCMGILYRIQFGVGENN